MIWAMDRNRLIGANNAMPWHLPNDLAYFMRTTKGHTVMMGRKTFESLNRTPLKNRHNIVITRDREYLAEGCTVMHSLEEAIEACGDEEVFVIGGAQIYEQAYPYADKLYITQINHAFKGDSWFPQFDLSDWTLISSREGTVDERNKYPHTFQIYVRK